MVRFATRTFLWSFLSMAVLLVGSFVAILGSVEANIGERVSASLRERQLTMGHMAAKSDAHNRRTLQAAVESAVLKAGVELLQTEHGSAAARLTVEDQLRELCGPLDCDFITLAGADGNTLAGLWNSGQHLEEMEPGFPVPPAAGLYSLRGGAYRVTSAAINQGRENLAVLYVGEREDLASLGTPAVLLRDGAVVRSTLPGVPDSHVAAGLAACDWQSQCDLTLSGQRYLALRSGESGGGYALYSFQNLDAALAGIRRTLSGVFLIAGIVGLLAALLIAAISSRSLSRPVAGLIAHLKSGEAAGVLSETAQPESRIREIKELTAGFNRAAAAIRESRRRLDRANVEFIGSLANALDARDTYTAGHSNRVSSYSCGIAAALGLPPEEIELIRVGALLHDVGKIGIPDSVLQKAGRLTAEQFAQIQLHPAIGRQILEGVAGLQQYLPIVELHHENWDGTGYPHGLCREETPLAARVVRVADAFDAMTSDRPYRAGMPLAKAVAIVRSGSGTEFDPVVVEAFLKAVQNWSVAPTGEVAALCAALSA